MKKDKLIKELLMKYPWEHGRMSPIVISNLLEKHGIIYVSDLYGWSLGDLYKKIKFFGRRKYWQLKYALEKGGYGAVGDIRVEDKVILGPFLYDAKNSFCYVRDGRIDKRNPEHTEILEMFAAPKGWHILWHVDDLKQTEYCFQSVAAFARIRLYSMDNDDDYMECIVPAIIWEKELAVLSFRQYLSLCSDGISLEEAIQDYTKEGR